MMMLDGGRKNDAFQGCRVAVELRWMDLSAVLSSIPGLFLLFS
jgi:hypothetical protein